MLEKGDTKIIGVVLCEPQDENNSQFLEKIAQYCREFGYAIMVYSSFTCFSDDDSYDQPMKCVFRMINYDILDGIIFFTESMKSPELIAEVTKRAKEKKIPVISLITPAKHTYNIRFDYKENFRAIISHVIEAHKCRKIFFVAGMKDNSFSDERIACYREEMEKHSLPVDERWIGYGNFWSDPTYALMDEWLKDKELGLPEAIICANDAMAIAVCIKLEEYGYRVPEDVIVTGHDGVAAERYNTPRLTNAVTDIDAAAKRAIKSISDIRAGKRVPKEIVINSKLVISESCGCKKNKHAGMNRRISEVYADSVVQIFMNDRFNEMAAALCKVNDFQEYLDVLSVYINLCWAAKAWICMPKSAYTPRHLTGDELADESTATQPETNFYENNRMTNVFRWDYQNGYTPEELEFDRADILPNLIDKLDDENGIILSPIYFRGLPQGYVALSTGLKNPNMKYTSIFMSYLNMTLELVMQKSFNSAAVSQLKYMYVQDFMTSLYNRRGFYTRIRPLLERCISLKKELVVISVDMDGLKKINDTYGHNEGDAAIKSLSQLLTQSAGENAITARFGGDEFVIAKICDKGKKEAELFSESLNRKIDAYNEISEKPYKIGASVGYTVTKPKNNDEIDTLIELADDIMYKQKEQHHKQTRG